MVLNKTFSVSNSDVLVSFSLTVHLTLDLCFHSITGEFEMVVRKRETRGKVFSEKGEWSDLAET